MSKSRTLGCLALAVTVGWVAAGTQGDTIAFSVLVDNGGLNYKAGPISGSGSFLLPQFDPTDPATGLPRRLDAMTIAIVGYAQNGFNGVDNESPFFTGVASVRIGVEIEVRSVTPAPVVVLVFPEDSKTGEPLAVDDPAEDLGGNGQVYGGFTLNADFAGPDSASVGGRTLTDANSATLDAANGDDLSPYIGTGNITWVFTSSLHTEASWTVNPAQALTDPPDFNFEAEVIYHYTVAPEPMSLALLALGAGLLVARRRCAAL